LVSQHNYEVHPDLKIMGAAFGEIAKGFRSYRVPLEASVREVLIPSIEENFVVGGRPPWTPLSEATLKRRESQGQGTDILRISDTLMSAATAYARWTVTRDTAAFTNFPSRAWYGILHQNADEYDVKFPARPFVMMQHQDLLAIRTIFSKWSYGLVVRNLRGRVSGVRWR
jgi:phage gpG-like protein